mmetsp:Transcript_24245/g.65716  ORF Transcript_24245/g.65716 Transcript_24245/m.65716 type:complete len:288 (+) Transcript_24245:1508-2371(+)
MLATKSRHAKAGNALLGHGEQQGHVAEHVLLGQPLLEVVHGCPDAVLSRHARLHLSAALAHRTRQQVVDLLYEDLRSELADGTWRRATARSPHHLAPKVLITEERAHERGPAGLQACSSGARASVMYDCSHLWDEPVVRAWANVKAQACREWSCYQSSPVALDEDALASSPGCCENYRSQRPRIWNDHGAEANHERPGSVREPLPEAWHLILRGGNFTLGAGSGDCAHDAHMWTPISGLGDERWRPQEGKGNPEPLEQVTAQCADLDARQLEDGGSPRVDHARTTHP